MLCPTQVMLSLEAEAVQTALTSTIPPPSVGLSQNLSQVSHPATDDEQLSEAQLLGQWTNQQVGTISCRYSHHACICMNRKLKKQFKYQ